MTQAQIKAINDAMSSISELIECPNTMVLLGEMNRHTFSMLDSGVDSEIIEHYTSICDSYYALMRHREQMWEQYGEL